MAVIPNPSFAPYSGIFAAELEVAIGLAKQAGDIALRHHGTKLQVDRKEGDEPVTLADRECSEFLVDTLASEFPHDVLISEEEEDNLRRLTPGRVWYIDPIDGTKAFIAGGTGYCIMLGLAIDHRPVLGVLYQPNHGTLLYACLGGGAWCERGGTRTRLRVSPLADPRDVRFVAKPGTTSKERQHIKEQFGIPETDPLRSIGLKLASMALGTCELYVNPATNCSSWDVCAPEILLHEAGGQLSDISGGALHYDNPETCSLQNGILASNGPMHESFTRRATQLYPELTPPPPPES